MIVRLLKQTLKKKKNGKTPKNNQKTGWLLMVTAPSVIELHGPSQSRYHMYTVSVCSIIFRQSGQLR